MPLTPLLHPISAALPLVLQFNVLQLLAVLLASLSCSHALSRMDGQTSNPALSAQLMLSLVLLSVALGSTLPAGDGTQPDPGLALMLRVVLGGVVVSAWHAVALRVRPLLVRA